MAWGLGPDGGLAGGLAFAVVGGLAGGFAWVVGGLAGGLAFVVVGGLAGGFAWVVGGAGAGFAKDGRATATAGDCISPSWSALSCSKRCARA